MEHALPCGILLKNHYLQLDHCLLLQTLHECISIKTCGTVSQKCITYIWGTYICAVNGEAELPSGGDMVLPLEDLKRLSGAELLKYHLGQCERGVLWTWERREETDSLLTPPWRACAYILEFSF